jgi:hypothetical protein
VVNIVMFCGVVVVVIWSAESSRRFDMSRSDGVAVRAHAVAVRCYAVAPLHRYHSTASGLNLSTTLIRSVLKLATVS